MTRRAAPRFSQASQCGDIAGGRIRDLGCSPHLTQRTPALDFQGLVIQASSEDNGQDPSKGRQIHLHGRDIESYSKCGKESQCL